MDDFYGLSEIYFVCQNMNQFILASVVPVWVEVFSCTKFTFLSAISWPVFSWREVGYINLDCI